MEKKKPTGLELLLDSFQEDALLNLISSELYAVQDCSRDIESATIKAEMALRRFLRRIEKELPPGAFGMD